MTLQLLPFPAADYAAWRTAQVERRRRWQFGPLWADAAAAAAQARTAVAELAPEDGLTGTYLLRVLGDHGEAGWLWLSRQDQDLLLLDADTDAPADELLTLLETHARSADARQLVLDRMVAAPATAALAAADGFAVVSQTMALDLTAEPSHAAPGVTLRPMTQRSFEAYLAAAIDEYAREIRRVDALRWDDALDRSRADYDELLPQGLATPGQVLLDVVETATGADVGALWLGLRPPSAAFVYDVWLTPPARGRGLGRAAMLAGAGWCRQRGVDVLGLSVFGHNVVARGLYESLGFGVVTEALRRPVVPAPPVTGPR
ncbi:GNAT family N-acetyltransferase [Xylanimonas protaetiae]|uniref:N-acetyltransferase n=1 Tax=Xylanimonas protaetiae TaxID=2509457 RepID=A0A4P6F3G3_9MICO|nr:GNAT family N-acetyltransferase [Xylanimonas protaetiae]QAY69213.1 N-acetyltransferase [Xylanimonas protaetiae]